MDDKRLVERIKEAAEAVSIAVQRGKQKGITERWRPETRQ